MDAATTPIPEGRHRYLIGFMTPAGQVGNTTMDFIMPVTAQDLPYIAQQIGFPDAIIMSISPLAQNRS